MSENVTISFPRSIGGLEIDCTILEQGADTYTATRHPVEQGAAITDHVYREPATLVMEVGFSNSSPKAQGSENYIIDIYVKLLNMQAKRQPLKVETGKRTYNNMIIASLSVKTDQETEAVLMCTVTMTEIIIVSTQVVSVPSANRQANPAKTGAVQVRGTIQPQPAALSPGTLASSIGSKLSIPNPIQEIPLISSPQSFGIKLDNVMYNMTASWKDLAKTAVGDAVSSLGGGWVLDIADQVGNALVQGIPLVTGSDLLGQFKYLGIGTQLIVQTAQELDAVPTFDNLGSLSHLYAALTDG